MQRSPEAENNSSLSAQTAIPPERGVLESFLHRERLRPASDDSDFRPVCAAACMPAGQVEREEKRKKSTCVKV